jgi:hypothetical protein
MDAAERVDLSGLQCARGGRSGLGATPSGRGADGAGRAAVGARKRHRQMQHDPPRRGLDPHGQPSTPAQRRDLRIGAGRARRPTPQVLNRT